MHFSITFGEIQSGKRECVLVINNNSVVTASMWVELYKKLVPNVQVWNMKNNCPYTLPKTQKVQPPQCTGGHVWGGKGSKQVKCICTDLHPRYGLKGPYGANVCRHPLTVFTLEPRKKNQSLMPGPNRKEILSCNRKRPLLAGMVGSCSAMGADGWADWDSFHNTMGNIAESSQKRKWRLKAKAEMRAI